MTPPYQWRILTKIVGRAKIIHKKFIYLIIVTSKIKINSITITKKEITHI